MSADRQPPTAALPPPGVRVTAGFRAALRYHALSVVPLARDEACLYRKEYAERWRETLAASGAAAHALDAAVAATTDALARAPGRLRHQVDVLVRPGERPGDGPVGALERLLEPSYREAWDAAADATQQCRLAFASLLAGRAPLLAPVRLAGIELLDLHLCPALSGAGRAARAGRTYAVALPLPADDAERAEAFVQLVHECCHPIADDAVAPDAGVAHDTARGSPGHRVHVLREDAALAVGYRWLAAFPRLRDEYLRWAGRYRDPAGLEARLAGAFDLPAPLRPAVIERGDACASAVPQT